MNDVNRDPIRWERSMTQDKDGQYVAYHDYAVLLESHDTLRADLDASEQRNTDAYAEMAGLRAEVERLQKDDATLRDAVMRLGEIAERRGAEVERLRAFVQSLIDATPKSFDLPLSEFNEEFVAWAKNRARSMMEKP